MPEVNPAAAVIHCALEDALAGQDAEDAPRSATRLALWLALLSALAVI
jgi:hypothetical protein